jgi:hypothetical protein
MNRCNATRHSAASVRALLLDKARAEKLDFNLLLTRYALERMLYRLSVSGQRGQFLLKGALLFAIWFDVPHRPTHDADLLGFGCADLPHLENLFRQISQIENDDGIVFQTGTAKAAEIRKEANYAGVRITLMGLLDGTRCPVQIDIGFGAMPSCLARRMRSTRSSSKECHHRSFWFIPATRSPPKSWKRWLRLVSSTAG